MPCPDECTPLDGCPQFARRYVQYDKKGEFTQVEQAAKTARKGLWGDANPVPPWEWRKSEKERRAAKKAAASGNSAIPIRL